jgi:hypothetical protein
MTAKRYTITVDVDVLGHHQIPDTVTITHAMHAMLNAGTTSVLLRKASIVERKS